MLLAAAGAVSATAQLVERGPEQMAGRVVRDPRHEGLEAVEVGTGLEAAADMGRVAPGRYRIRLRGRFLGEANVRYSMALAATVNGEPVAARAFWANAAAADGEYHELAEDVSVRSAGTLGLRLSWQDHAREEDAKAVRDQKLANLAAEVEAPEWETLPALDGDAAAAGTRDLEGEIAGIPLPSGPESFLLAAVEVEPLVSPFIVTRVWPDKIHYYPGETVTVQVDVTRVGGATEPGTLVVAVLTGLEDSRELLREAITLGPGETLTRQLDFAAESAYGHEVRATASGPEASGGHSASAYFGVSENVFELSVQGWAGSRDLPSIVTDPETMRGLLAMPQDELEAKAAEAALAARQSYCNHVENYAWAPDDFFDLSPHADVWWSGTGTYLKFKRIILARNRALQRHGIKVLSYAQPSGVGLATLENLRTHPEYFAYASDGRPAVFYDYDLIKSRTRFDMGIRQVEPGGGLNRFDLRTIDRGIDAVIASWKMFGWDGVRYDNRYYRANNPLTWTGDRATAETDLDPYSARNVKRQKERFWSEIGPRWLISHNNGYRFHTEDNRLGWEETVKDGLMCMDEETCSADSEVSSLNPWLEYMRFALEARRFCTKLGGYYQLFPPGRGNTPAVDMLYYVVACAASGSHPLSCDVEHSPAGRYGRFLTRWSAMLFARDIVPLPDPAAYVAFPGCAEDALWWREFANTRVAAGVRWLLLPLVVPPAHPRIAQDPASVIPGRSPALRVVLKASAFADRPRAYLLSAERDPMRTRLALDRGPEGYGADLPRIAHFGLLVIETEAE